MAGLKPLPSLNSSSTNDDSRFLHDVPMRALVPQNAPTLLLSGPSSSITLQYAVNYTADSDLNETYLCE